MVSVFSRRGPRYRDSAAGSSEAAENVVNAGNASDWSSTAGCSKMVASEGASTAGCSNVVEQDEEHDGAKTAGCCRIVVAAGASTAGCCRTTGASVRMKYFPLLCARAFALLASATVEANAKRAANMGFIAIPLKDKFLHDVRRQSVVTVPFSARD